MGYAVLLSVIWPRFQSAPPGGRLCGIESSQGTDIIDLDASVFKRLCMVLRETQRE